MSGRLRSRLRAALLVGMVVALLGVPLASSANPDISGFELDGNAAGGGANDWDSIGGALEFTGIIADPTGPSDQGYTTGGSKDTNDVSEWRWKEGDVTPDKDDIRNAYAAVYSEQNDLVLYFGQDRVLDRSGDANVGFWFLQNAVGLNADGSFSGTHADGDLLVQSEFTNGGDVSGVKIFKWQSGALVAVEDQAECVGGKLGTADACAIVNSGNITTSWAGTITSPYFFEGGLNLSALFPQQVPCFSTFLTNTRTSQSESAQLKDFAMGSIDTCASIKISKVAAPSDSSQFSFTTTGGLDPASFSLADGGSRSYAKLQPGQYSVTESGPSGAWAFDSLSCSTVSGPGTSAQVNGQTVSITLGFLGNVECTYVNKRKPEVKVVKVLEPAGDPGKFDLQINGVTRADDVGNGGDTGFHEVAPGQQVTVGELAGAGTSLGNYVSRVECDSGKGSANPGTSHAFTANFGDRVTCTITNSRKPEVKVAKVIVPASDSGRFNLLINGNVELANAASGQDTGFEQVAVGPVSVGESAGTATSLGNYDSKVECDSGKGSANPGTSHGFSVAYGDRVTCTITNTRKATLTVIKHVVNDNGGSKTAADFPISVSGNAPSPSSFAGAESPGTSVSIGPGAYSVSETEDPGYAASYSAGCSGTIPAGGSATCTITNNDRPATLTVIKTVVNDNGGTAVAGDFTMTINGVSAAGGNSFPGAAAPGTTKVLTSVGSYSVTESSLAGYTQTSASADCSGTIALGQSKTCTIVNDDRAATLIVKKVVINDDGGTKQAQDFSFQVNGGAAVAFEADGQNDLSVNAGTYSVLEPAVEGYATSYSNCSNLVIPNGGSATCTITNNDRPATLIVKKIVVNDHGGTKQAQDFSFQVNGGSAQAFEADGQNNLTVAAGTYSVVEPAVAGYETSYSNCSNLVIPNGGSATCTITNDDRPAELIVRKVVINDDGGTATADNFSFQVNGGNPIQFQEDGQNEGTVSAGTYSVVELPVAGYATSYDNCSNIVIPNGGSAICTITNNDRPATLIVKKVVINDNGGTKQAQDFSFQVNGGSAQAFEADGQNNLTVAAGTYSVVEPEVAGYGTTYSNCSNLVIPNGGSATCTITNDDVAATLTVIKHVINDNGGDAVASDFTMTINGVSAGGGNSFPGAEAPGVVKQLTSVGAYSVTESSVAGYVQTSASAGCSGTIALGESKTCTIVNDDRPATLIVKKVVINDDGGTKQAQDFSFQVNGGAAVAFEADGQNELTVDAGSYAVTEPAVEGYATTYAGCSDIELGPGETATCTITNNDRPATLIVKKVVINDDGGTATADDFSFQVNGGAAIAFQADGQNDLTVAAGTYSVLEPAVEGYATSYSNCSNLVIPNGGSATCTITNDDRPATLIVKKVVINDNGGTHQPHDFSFQVNGGQAIAFESDGQNEQTVPAGVYNVTEPAVAGYTTTYHGCSGIELELGESATCVITNNDVPRGRGSIDVQKSATPTTMKEPGGPVTFSVTITNTSVDVDVTITNVVDDKFGDLDDSGGNGCFDIPINLAPGEKVNCTFQRQITGPGGTSHVNVVTASGSDENGNPVSDSDDARVDITERLIDLVIVKDASSPTPLNGIVNYSLTVTNKGPDTATNVQLADPAPAGISYLTANPSQGTCSVAPALITCSLGSIAPGQTVTIAITARATSVGTHTNTATVTGTGGRETNPADNVDSAVTVVPAPLQPPTSTPKPKPEPCLTLTVSPKMITADGKPERVSVKVTAGGKRMAGVKVSISGAGVKKTARSNAKGMAHLRINPRRPGLITITALETNRKVCGAKRIGVVGVFLPPLTG